MSWGRRGCQRGLRSLWEAPPLQVMPFRFFPENVTISNDFGQMNDKNHTFLVAPCPFNSCSSPQNSESAATDDVWACPTVLPMICYPH